MRRATSAASGVSPSSASTRARSSSGSHATPKYAAEASAATVSTRRDGWKQSHSAAADRPSETNVANGWKPGPPESVEITKYSGISRTAISAGSRARGPSPRRQCSYPSADSVKSGTSAVTVGLNTDSPSPRWRTQNMRASGTTASSKSNANAPPNSATKRVRTAASATSAAAPKNGPAEVPHRTGIRRERVGPRQSGSSSSCSARGSSSGCG